MNKVDMLLLVGFALIVVVPLAIYFDLFVAWSKGYSSYREYLRGQINEMQEEDAAVRPAPPELMARRRKFQWMAFGLTVVGFLACWVSNGPRWILVLDLVAAVFNAAMLHLTAPREPH